LSPVFLVHTVIPIKTHGEYKYELISWNKLSINLRTSP
jgi:hypothetical protein